MARLRGSATPGYRDRNKDTNEIIRCGRCSGILKAEDFEVDEACRCETPRGRKARATALRGAEDYRSAEERPASLHELLSDTGRIW